MGSTKPNAEVGFQFTEKANKHFGVTWQAGIVPNEMAFKFSTGPSVFIINDLDGTDVSLTPLTGFYVQTDHPEQAGSGILFGGSFNLWDNASSDSRYGVGLQAMYNTSKEGVSVGSSLGFRF